MGRSSFHVSKANQRHGSNNAKRAGAFSFVVKSSSGFLIPESLITACSTFITSPSSNEQVDVNQPVKFGWDNTCLNATEVDIYLYAPYSASSSVIQIFQAVSNSDGSYNVRITC